MRWLPSSLQLNKRSAPFLLALILLFTCLVFIPHAKGDRLGGRSLEVSDSTASAKASYTISFTTTTPGTLGSIDVQFCSNDPFPGTPCTAPVGFSDSAATLSTQSGATGFSISPSSTANEIILTRAPVPVGSAPVSYEFSGVTNPSSDGSYFVRVETFATSDASGPASDYGGLAFSMNQPVSISAEVPPYIIFCTGVTIPSYNCASASGNYDNLGELSPGYTASSSSQMLVATNAKDGYTISLGGTTLTSGNNVIGAIATADVSRPGTNQFGLNLRANATPGVGQNVSGSGSGLPTANYNQPNFYKFKSGDVVASSVTADGYRRYTVSYIADMAKGQAPGYYASTVSYICLASF